MRERIPGRSGKGVMTMYLGMNSNLNSNFFSSMLGSNSTGSGFGSLYSSLADYASIKNGSYGKLVKAYYSQMSTDDKTSTKKNSTTKVKEKEQDDTTKKNLTETKTKSDALKKSAGALVDVGKKSLFTKVDVKDEETGKTTQQYDTDKIYKAVKQFASDYNALIADTAKSTSTSVARKGITLKGEISARKDMLADIGITINSDNTLSVDEEKFKASDMRDVKDLFNGSHSLGAKVYQKAMEINNLSTSAASSTSLYNSNATYAASYAGTLYNGSL